MRYTGPYGPPLSRFWEERFKPWLFVRGLLDAERFGLCLDDPWRTPPEACRYDCCVRAPAGIEPDTATRRHVLAAGECLVLDFYGTQDFVDASWSKLWRSQLPPGYQLDEARAPFEHYRAGARFDPVTRAFECQFCLPVR